MKYIVFITLFVFLSFIAQAQAGHKEDFDTLTIYWENDLFLGTDRDYTNGIKLTLSTPYKTDETDSHLPGWSYSVINLLPFLNDPKKQRAVSLSLGQNLYTPEDTDRSDVDEDDRPYAGITYLAVGFHSKTERRKYSWEFQIGIVGPHSYGEEVQNWAHDLIDKQRAKGWDNQLEDEFIFEGIFENQRRIYHSDINENFSYDLISHLGGRIGNVSIYTNAGAEARIGWHLPRDFGTCPIRAGCETNSAFDELETKLFRTRMLGINLFAAMDGRAVLWDITLDGNTYKDSHSVDKEVFVADLMAGIGLEYGRIKASYSYIYRTKQFKTQDYDPIFGAVSFSYSY